MNAPALPPELTLTFVSDEDVDVAVDHELRSLLSSCFPGEEGAASIFAHKRYNYEMPPWRWMVRERATGRLAAHLAMHDKTLGSETGDLRIGGVAEVAVDRAWRGRRLVGIMLDAAHAYVAAQGIRHAALLGNPKVYQSSGYTCYDNLVCYLSPEGEPREEHLDYFLARPLTDEPWPQGRIDLRGRFF